MSDQDLLGITTCLVSRRPTRVCINRCCPAGQGPASLGLAVAQEPALPGPGLKGRSATGAAAAAAAAAARSHLRVLGPLVRLRRPLHQLLDVLRMNFEFACFPITKTAGCADMHAVTALPEGRSRRCATGIPGLRPTAGDTRSGLNPINCSATPRPCGARAEPAALPFVHLCTPTLQWVTLLGACGPAP